MTHLHVGIEDHYDLFGRLGEVNRSATIQDEAGNSHARAGLARAEGDLAGDHLVIVLLS
jgi:hypothetical protein